MRDAEFAHPGPLRDRLVAAILAGEKTATSSLVSDWEAYDEAVPHAGERMTVIDSSGNAVATIEIESVVVIPFGDADLALARDEGEGFESVDQWRAAHEDFWRGRAQLDDSTEIVVERFRLVEP